LEIEDRSAPLNYSKFALQILEHDVIVYVEGHPQRGPLHKAGKNIANRFYEATGGHGANNSLFAGAPTVVVEDASTSSISDGRLRRAKGSLSDARIYFRTIKLKSSRDVPLWVLRSNPQHSKRAARSHLREVRRYLLRIAAELEVVATAATHQKLDVTYEVVSDVASLLVDATLRGSSIQPIMVEVLAAFRAFRPSIFEYLLAGLATSKNDLRFLVSSMGDNREWDMAREPSLSKSRQRAIIARGRRDAAYEEPPQQLIQQFISIARTSVNEQNVIHGDSYREIHSSKILNRVSSQTASPTAKEDARPLVESLMRLAEQTGQKEVLAVTEGLVDEVFQGGQTYIVEALYYRLSEVLPEADKEAVLSSIKELLVRAALPSRT
jgi:hypothetical protein